MGDDSDNLVNREDVPPPAAMGDDNLVNREDAPPPAERFEIPRGPLGNKIVVVPVLTPVALWGLALQSASAPAIIPPPPAAPPAPSDSGSSTDGSIMDDLPPMPKDGIGDVSPVEIQRRYSEYEAALEEKRAISAARKAVEKRRIAARSRRRKARHSLLEICHDVGFEYEDLPESAHPSNSPGPSAPGTKKRATKNARSKPKRAQKTSVARKGKAARRTKVTQKGKASQATRRPMGTRKGKAPLREPKSTPPPNSEEEGGIGSDYEAPAALQSDISESAEYIWAQAAQSDAPGPSVPTAIRRAAIQAELMAKQAPEEAESPEPVGKRNGRARDPSPEY